MQHSTKFIFLFALGICLVCSLMVSVAAVSLRDEQAINRELDMKKSVLEASQLLKPGEGATRAVIEEKFAAIKPRVIDLETGEYVDVSDPAKFNEDAPENLETAEGAATGLSTAPKQRRIFHVMKGDVVDTLILPIEGKGLWSTLEGYLALDSDTNTVRGITYYAHKETPGLGGEVDNPKWKSRWIGRKIYGDKWEVRLQVIKGPAGSPTDDPHHIDGLSGSTITSRGVTNMMGYWLGQEGYGPYLEKFRAKKDA